MDQFEATRVFARVVQTGSFSAAARSEGTTQSAVSKKIQSLETHLGCQLLVRNNRSLSTTEAGDEYYVRCESILQDLEAAEAATRGAGSSLQATLRVSMSPVVARLLIAPIIAEFSEQHPQLHIA
ncbi:MAG: LysR family transcriptional regulator, partial [bacterium]